MCTKLVAFVFAVLVICIPNRTLSFAVGKSGSLKMESKSGAIESKLCGSFADDCEGDERNAAILALVDEARRIGPVANDQPDDTKATFLDRARRLQPLSDPRPAKIDFTGVHDRLYSTTAGKKYGRIQQTFVDATRLVNSVTLLGGAVQISIGARYEAQDDTTGVITYDDEQCIALFGRTVYMKKQTSMSTDGVGYPWNFLFVGTFVDHDGKRKRLRIMETPSPFLLLQDVE